MMSWMMSSMDKVQINIIILNNYISYGYYFDNFIHCVVQAYKLTFIFFVILYDIYNLIISYIYLIITILLLILIN
jgi:hypothetical protein